MHEISPDLLTLDRLAFLLRDGGAVGLSARSRERIAACQAFLEAKITGTDQTYYGINTGFGALCQVPVGPAEREALQVNLIMSHACGTGEELPAVVVRLMLLLKVQGLSLGYSGVRPETVERLLDFYNADVLPVVFEQGSLGASGDLCPLAHLSLPLLGLGMVRHRGRLLAAADVLAEHGWTSLALKAKEGLALLNGTQFCQAAGIWAILESRRLLRLANHCAALSLDAFSCRLSPFHPALHRIRPHAGQQQVAREVLELLDGSELSAAEKTFVQDPYSFRCVPQVHGASYDVIQQVQQTFQTEINAVTDNPTLFPEEDLILSGGNFHAQPLALGLDFLAIAMAEIASISERRTYQLISGQRGLPPFLTRNGGLHSGLMIPQYTAAGIVSQNKQWCTPASVDSIVSSNGQEDHVSMGANAATKAMRVVRNVERVLAIEWMTAAQALSFRHPVRTAPRLEAILSDYRAVVPPLVDDRILHDDIQATIRFLREKLGPALSAED
jgi:histidine ammonia-lyase